METSAESMGVWLQGFFSPPRTSMMCLAAIFYTNTKLKIQIKTPNPQLILFCDHS